MPIKEGKVLLIQGVRSIYDVNEGKVSADSQDESKLVLIGRGVDQSAFRDSLLSILESR